MRVLKVTSDFSTRSVVRFAVHFAVKHDDCVRRNDRVASMLASDMLRLCFCEFFDEQNRETGFYLALVYICGDNLVFYAHIRKNSLAARRGRGTAIRTTERVLSR